MVDKMDAEKRWLLMEGCCQISKESVESSGVSWCDVVNNFISQDVCACLCMCLYRKSIPNE